MCVERAEQQRRSSVYCIQVSTAGAFRPCRPESSIRSVSLHSIRRLALAIALVVLSSAGLVAQVTAIIRPTETWQTATVHLGNPSDFRVDDNFYVVPKAVDATSRP